MGLQRTKLLGIQAVTGVSTVGILTVGTTPTAVGIASIGRDGTSNVLKAIYVENAGRGYSSNPQVTIADPETLAGLGTYFFNEIVIGSRSGTYARVKEWDQDTKILKISNVGIGTTQTRFQRGENIVGQESGASYPVQEYRHEDIYDKYTENDEFEVQADEILDFSERNPFGTF